MSVGSISEDFDLENYRLHESELDFSINFLDSSVMNGVDNFAPGEGGPGVQPIPLLGPDGQIIPIPPQPMQAGLHEQAAQGVAQAMANAHVDHPESESGSEYEEAEEPGDIVPVDVPVAKEFPEKCPDPPDQTRKEYEGPKFEFKEFDSDKFESKFHRLGKEFDMKGKDLASYISENVEKMEEKHNRSEERREERLKAEKKEWEKSEDRRIAGLVEKWRYEHSLWVQRKSDWDRTEQQKIKDAMDRLDKETERKEREKRERRERKEREKERREREKRDKDFQKMIAGLASADETRQNNLSALQQQTVDAMSRVGRGDRDPDPYKLNIPPFKDGEDIEKYLEQFERTAGLHKWSDNKKAIRIGNLLTGKARDAYLKIPADKLEDWAFVKQAILEEYHLTAERCRIKFRTESKKTDENFKQFAERQRKMFEKWMEMEKWDKSVGRLVEILLLEVFYYHLTHDLAMYVREHKPATAKDAAELAYEKVESKRAVKDAESAGLSAHPKNPQNLRAIRGGKIQGGPGGFGKNRPNSQRGRGGLQRGGQGRGGQNRGGRGGYSGGTGNDSRKKDDEDSKSKEQLAAMANNKLDDDPVLSVSMYRKLMAEGKCIKCREKFGRGHTCAAIMVGGMRDVEVPENVVPKDVSQVARVSSDKPNPLWEHLSPLCQLCENIPWERKINIKVNGQVVLAMRDTGSDELVIAPHLVKSKDYLSEFTEIRLAVCSVHDVYPRAVVELDSPYIKGKVQCVVVKGINPPVIIGDKVRRVSGKWEAVPVYPLTHLMAVETRAAKQRESRPTEPLPIKELDKIDVTREELIKMQEEDETLSWARQQAEKKIVKKNKKDHEVSFFKSRGILKRGFRKGRDWKTQVCIPQPLRRKVIQLGHDMPMSGHMGRKRTLERIWEEFYWPSMSAQVARYVMSCERCQKVSPRGKVPKAPLERVLIETVPFDKVAVDLVGPITPPSESKMRFILVLVDYATRYPEATALKGIDSVQVAEALWVMFSRLGTPGEILSDQGSQFTSDTMKEVHALLGVKGVTTTPYHAMANGLVERFNGTLKTMLRKLCADKPQTWDRFIPALLFAYREVPQESTGYSPFELLYGRSVRGPMYLLRALWTKEQREEVSKNVSQYVFELRNRLEDTCKVVQENLDRKAITYKKHFDRKAKPRSFLVGQKVLLLLPEKKNKLEMSWQGPFEIVEKIGLSDYRINRRGKTKVFHINMLKEWQGEPRICAVSVVDQEDVNEIQELDSQRDKIPLMALEQSETVKDVKYGDNKEVCDNIKAFLATKTRIMTDLPLRTNIELGRIEQDIPGPARGKQWTIPFDRREDMSKEVLKMEEMQVIRRSTSDYSSPVVLVKKPDGTYRFCVDFRELNKRVRFDSEAIPDPNYLFSKFSKAQIFSKFDLCKGYWQIELAEEDRHKTAFTTPIGLYEWNVLPFGLKTSGAIFSRMMRKLLLPLKDPDIDNYIDDVCIASKENQAHIQSIRKLISRMDEANIAARPSKCEIGMDQVEFLGHRVGHDQITPMDKKLEKIQKAEPPKTKKQIKSFLGLTGYYRKFVPGYSDVALPLTNALKKGQPNLIEWNQEKREAFEKLKSVLVSKPVCVLPDFDKDFYLRTDASDYGLGGLLLQKGPDGDFRIVGCVSRKLKDAETRYSAVERECLAIVWAIKKFEAYLYGRKFTVQSDHQPLSWMSNVRAENKRLMRWAIFLQDQNIVYQAIPGDENHGADFLSRM